MSVADLVWVPLVDTGGTLRPKESYGDLELCAVGGQYVIVRGGGGDKPMETARGRYADTVEVWQELVAEYRPRRRRG